ncbi:MAG: chromate transporter [Clostridiales bacterium]|jgi:chromate transporter|nr:chromate transporter [Clostridiales bacterium]
MILLKLFWSFFQIGLFSFGGGYAAMPFIQEQAVDINGWLTMGEFVDLVTISQMTPGPIAINAATFIGMKTSGVLGAIIATIGCVTPSCIIVLTLAYLYYKYRGLPAIQGVLKGLRPAVVSLIAFAGISIVQMALFGGKSESIFSIDISSFDVVSGVLFAAALVVMRRFKPNPIYVMAGAGFVGLLAFYII